MDIVRLYQDFDVQHKTEGHKHCRPGWVNTGCPYCEGNPGFHLGWNIEDEYFFCWRCGWHPTVSTISQLTGLLWVQVKEILPKYGINRTIIQSIKKHKVKFKLPSHLGLCNAHFDYLYDRGFNPYEIEEKWKISGTGPISKLDKVDYRFRIIIPYFWNGEMISFDARDITGKQENKYKACPEQYEILPRKEILYGNQECWDPNLGICVEGPTDVWRIGSLAFAVSGIQYKKEQIRIMANIFKRIAVIFDPEIQAQIQAKILVAELKFRGVDAFNVVISAKDPGSMTQREVNELLKRL